MEESIFSALSHAVSTFYTNLADGPRGFIFHCHHSPNVAVVLLIALVFGANIWFAPMEDRDANRRGRHHPNFEWEHQ